MQTPDDFPETYAAYFEPRKHKFETIDFRDAPTPHNLRNLFPRDTRQRHMQARYAGLLGITVALSISIVGFGMDQLTRGLTLALYKLSTPLLHKSFWAAFASFISVTLLYAIIPASFVVFFAPLGAGSGIPELKAYLNGVRIPAFLSIRTLFVKAVGIAFSISSGLICGKQGPTIHVGSIIGAAVSQAASSTFRFRLKIPFLRTFRTEAWKRDFTAVGAAVGVAVAFGSPMGAWMWVYEEACTYWSWELGIITLSACLTGAGITRVLNYVAAGLPGGGFEDFKLKQVGKLVTPFEGTAFPIKDLPAFVLVGFIGGVLGVILPLINKRITLIRYQKVTRPATRLFETCLIACLTATFRILVPYLLDDCIKQDADESNALSSVLQNAPLGDFSRFNCEEGYFSPWAVVLYNPSDTIIRGLLFHSGSNAYVPTPVAVALVFNFVFIIWTYGIAVPSGVFFPGFVLGGIYGRLIGIAVQAIFPARNDISLQSYAFIGSVSALAGITRTISVAVIALEATGGGSAMFATVLVAIIAKLVADFIYDRGIYDLHIGLKGMPYLANAVPSLEKYSQVRVAEVMESSIMAVRRRSQISNLLNLLKSNRHHAFPVFYKVVPEPTENPRSSSTQQASGMGLSGGTELEEDETSDLDSDIGRHGPIHPSRIILPTFSGMKATIFDEGKKHVIWLPNRSNQWIGKVHETGEGSGTPDKSERDNLRKLPGGGRVLESTLGGTLDYRLIGTIDRGTLLVLLKHECDKREMGDNASPSVCREDLDAAWPNPSRVKGDGEKLLIERVKKADILDEVLDLFEFTDPDPVLISDRSPSMAAYRLFRRTGTRHILVANMRSGLISGIVTRKDILPESINEILNRRNTLRHVKVQ